MAIKSPDVITETSPEEAVVKESPELRLSRRPSVCVRQFFEELGSTVSVIGVSTAKLVLGRNLSSSETQYAVGGVIALAGMSATAVGSIYMRDWRIVLTGAVFAGFGILLALKEE